MQALINIFFLKKEHKPMTEKKKKKKSDEQYILNKLESIVAFTYLPNKCHNVFTKNLFLVVVSHSLIFYYFILTYKKLTLQ